MAEGYAYLEEVNDGILRQFRRLAPMRGSVLDVGCGRGVLSEAVRALGWEVWGIERNPEACAAARPRLDRLIEADLEDEDTIDRLLGEHCFDALVFSDVLEHLADPLAVLRRYLARVRPGGKVLISVPNLVVWTNRIKLLLGHVQQADSGVMDRTHLRLFSFRLARRLVQESGCRLERVDQTPYLARALLPVVKWVIAARAGGRITNPRALIDSRAYRLYLRYVYPLERAVASLWKTLFAFRIVLVATRPAEEECPCHERRVEPRHADGRHDHAQRGEGHRQGDRRHSPGRA